MSRTAKATEEKPAEEAAASRNGRSDEEIFSRPSLQLTIGGKTRYLPILAIDPTEEWKERFSATLARLWGQIQTIEGGQATGTVAMVGLANQLTSELLELVVGYDVDAALGGREYLGRNATPDEIYAAAKEIAGHVYPFARDVGRFPQLLDALLEITARASGGSTNSPSESGG